MSEPVTVAELSIAIAALQTVHPLNCDIDPKQLDSLSKQNRQFLADQITAVLRDPKNNTPQEWRSGGVGGVLQVRKLDSERKAREDPNADPSCLVVSMSAFRKLTDLILSLRAQRLLANVMG